MVKFKYKQISFIQAIQIKKQLWKLYSFCPSLTLLILAVFVEEKLNITIEVSYSSAQNTQENYFK